MKNVLVTLLALAIASMSAIAQKPDSSATPIPKPIPSPSVKLPAAKAIVAKYVKAIGGREALLKHKSRYQTGSIELSPMGVKGTIESYSRSDDRALTKVSLAGVGDILDGFDGTMGWTSNPVQGSRIKEGKELQQAKRLSTFAREANLEKIYTTLTVRGTEKVGDRYSYVIVASTEGLPDDILYFDTETGLMLRSDSVAIVPEGQQTTTTFYEDYRDVNGIKTAFRLRAKTPAFEITTIVSEIKYDVPIEDSKFARPN